MLGWVYLQCIVRCFRCWRSSVFFSESHELLSSYLQGLGEEVVGVGVNLHYWRSLSSIIFTSHIFKVWSLLLDCSDAISGHYQKTFFDKYFGLLPFLSGLLLNGVCRHKEHDSIIVLGC